ncbi:hypothetical protein [Bifidobacterium olomucense]|uniref:Uncharacterized protein n=1 Tax=Bifidobacterium olomucense TaxID=2675324 RepID=A0A7Y0EXE1_9BIFI|nr:hypothetical protein [Bifidobacterium sp. DSM 109959]NMM98165.1 hypothetical protein [Bifidobacterium sp. DSM 109959]
MAEAKPSDILDLRPKQGSILYEMLRLGLVFDHSDDGTAQTWCDYEKNLRADFQSIDAGKVTFTDMDTRLASDVDVADLPAVAEIVTWKSSQSETV